MKWSPPVVVTIKINFDCAVFKDRGGGAGIIAWDQRGKCITWWRKLLPGVTDPEVGKACAVRLAVDLCCKFNLEKVQIEGDCMQVIQKL